ncbi:MAG: hypothetical protein AB1439_10870 [candidate division FCPU426 bacterium]
MRRFVILGAMIMLVGCQRMVSLPGDFKLETFKRWEVKRQAKFINSLQPEAKRAFLRILMPNGYFNIEENEVKFLGGEVFVCDFKKDVGGYAGDPGPDGRFNYILGRWRLIFDELILLNPRSDENIHFMGKELILDNSSYTAEDNSGLLVLIFTIMKSSRMENYGEIPLVFLPNPVESPAIADYTKQLGN